MPNSRLTLIALIIGIATVGAFASPRDAIAQTNAADPSASASTEDRFAPIQAMMDEAVESGRIPAAIAMLALNDQTIWRGVAGEMGPGAAMREDAIMPLASIGKMYTATAVMILVERGEIALDDPVSRYIPEFADVQVAVVGEDGETTLAPPDRPITIYDLLTHTAGLRMDGDAFWSAWNEHVERTTALQMARALAALPLESQPGERFNYGPTGASYAAVGAIVEIVSGQTLEEFMQENIFTPLDLNETYFFTPDDLIARVPAFYRAGDDGLEIDRPYGEVEERNAYFNGAGGIAASPRDIQRFARLFVNDGEVDGVRILSAETIGFMMSDQLGERAPDGELSWGIGAAVPSGASAEEPRQYGWVGGNYAILFVDRPSGLIAYFAFPVRPPGDGELLTHFRSAVLSALAPPAPGGGQ